MKKFLSANIIMTVLMALVIAPAAFSDEGCPATKTKGSAKKATIENKACTAEQIAACAKMAGVSPEECAKHCAGKTNCEFTALSIKGMTCEACEKTIKETLMEVEGVHNVVKVSHEEGKAWVCYAPDKVKTDDLTASITRKGYRAEVIPAVMKSSEEKAQIKPVDCSRTCSSKAREKCKKKKTEGGI